MANDREVLKEVWDGKIPSKFIVDSEDIEVDAFFVLLPRVSYLSLTIEKIKKHFQRYIEKEDEIWFSFNSIPLKFHIPIGVLYDLIGSEHVLPWQINVHFNKFPEECLFKFPNKDVIESFFMNCLKEADFLKHKGQIVSQMQKKEHKQLFLGLQNDKFDQFWAVNRRLMESMEQENYFKFIPLRCYTDDGYSYMQKLICPLTEKGQKKVLKDLLKELSTPVLKAVGAKTHGVEVPLDAELQWLSETLSYPDNFLHLCLIYE
ncbi:autophagy protein 5 [Chironomus tepperi]|uniref:autophagy protein 5 n=1 Tax=Chironomus tepperi TaxID=113505 RepID=UPI00391F135A